MPNFIQMLPLFRQYMSNPAAFLASKGLNIPQEYMGSPEMASKYLLQNSGMSQSNINQIMQAASQFQNFMGNGQGGNPIR